MNNTSSSSSINFALLNQEINRYAPIPLLFFGTIGNILNILVFTRGTFRNNICVTYFLGSTVFDSFIIVVGLLSRLLTGFNADVSQNSAVLCKLRFFITYFAGYAAAWLIGFACIERYLSSSTNVHRRQLITMKRAYLSIVVVVLLGFIIFGEQFYCIDINQQLLGAPQSCYQLKANIQCQIVDSLMQFIFEILVPAVMMLVFGFLTYRNVRQQRHRINNIITSVKKQAYPANVNRAIQKRDAQLITMLLVQVAVFVITTFPIGVYKIYSVATIYETKSILRISIENTIFNVSVISLFINNTIRFYINTLCGTVFRKELMKLFRLTQAVD